MTIIRERADFLLLILLIIRRKKSLPPTEKSAYRGLKKVLTADRKICLPSAEKTPYRMMAKSSYRAQFEEKSLADIKAYIYETREHGLILGDKYITHDLVPSFYLAD